MRLALRWRPRSRGASRPPPMGWSGGMISSLRWMGSWPARAAGAAGWCWWPGSRGSARPGWPRRPRGAPPRRAWAWPGGAATRGTARRRCGPGPRWCASWPPTSLPGSSPACWGHRPPDSASCCPSWPRRPHRPGRGRLRTWGQRGSSSTRRSPGCCADSQRPGRCWSSSMTCTGRTCRRCRCWRSWPPSSKTPAWWWWAPTGTWRRRPASRWPTRSARWPASRWWSGSRWAAWTGPT